MARGRVERSDVYRIDRREFVRAIVGSAAGLSFTAVVGGTPVAGRTPPAITVTRLTDRISMLSGGGGNVGVVVAPKGLCLVDGGLTASSAGLLDAAASVSGGAVRVLFNTHWHFDHVGSNELLGRGGTRIVAHENVRARLSVRFVSDAFERTFEPLVAGGLPGQTFTDGGIMAFGAERVEYRHIPEAHTDGDAYAFFPNANVLHTGDLGWNGLYPVIDYSVGGWIGGMVTALDELLNVGDAETRIIPGHGPLARKDNLRASRDMLARVHERLVPLVARRMTLEEVRAAAPTADLDTLWGDSSVRFLRQAYNSLLARA